MTEDEARQFAASLIAAFNRGDGVATGQHLDWQAVLERATSGIPADDKLRTDFIDETLKLQELPMSWGQKLALTSYSGARLSLMRQQEHGGKRFVVFRIRMPDNTLVNYMNFELAHTAEGRVQAVDCYFTTNGEWLSQTARSGYLQQAIESDPGVVEKVAAADRVAAVNSVPIGVFRDKIARGQSKDALLQYRLLSPEAQELKPILLSCLKAAAEVDAPSFVIALMKMREKYPREPAGECQAIDFLFNQGDFDGSLDAIGRLEKSMGADPFLAVLAASVHVNSGRLDKARAEAERAARSDPSIQEAFVLRFQIACLAKNFPDAVAWLDQVRNRFGEEPVGLMLAPDFAEFRRSDAYIKWRAKHPPIDMIGRSLATAKESVAEADVRRVAELFAQSALRLDLATIDGLVDWHYVAAQAMKGLKIEEPLKQDFVQRTRSGSQVLQSTLLVPISQGASYSQLRVYQQQGTWQVLMRLITPQGLPDYQLLSFVRNTSGRVVISGILDFGQGESVAQQMRTSVIMSGVQGAGSEPQSLAPEFATLRSYHQLMQEKKGSEALSELAKLPESFRKTKSIMLRKVAAASIVGGEIYAQAVEEMQKAFPTDPATMTLLVEFHMTRREHVAAIEAIRDLDHVVGGDPFLHVLAGNEYFALKDYKSSRQELELAIEGGLKTAVAYQACASAAAKEGQFAIAVKCLQELVATYNMPFEKIEEMFAGEQALLASEEYQTWIKTPVPIKPAKANKNESR